MKSNKQRRAEIIGKRQIDKDMKAAEMASVRNAEWTRDASKAARVDAGKLAPDGSYGVPDFVTRGYYVNVAFVCQACGKHELWTATQQKWWYEVAKGGVWTTARLCRPCRRRERERRNEARRIHLEGIARKTHRGVSGA
jgi:hypothetical protein